MWEKREAEWRRECSARQKLMNEVHTHTCTFIQCICPHVCYVVYYFVPQVLEERQQQIEERLDIAKGKQVRM